MAAGRKNGGYPVNGDDEHLLGTGPDDHDRLFPKYTVAQAASVNEVIVNGKNIMIWEFSQLETLKPSVLRSRAMAIRDAVGEASCPPMPSAQSADMIRWILHMQSTLVETIDNGGRFNRNAMQGSKPSQSFIQETQDRPITFDRPLSPRAKALPFGPRMIPNGMDATRDHYGDLLEQRYEFSEAKQQGIATMRVGGEGRRHIFPKDNMVNDGVSNAAQRGIETMKEQGEGRKYLACADNLFEQQRELEAIQKGGVQRVIRPRAGPESMRRGGENMHRVLAPDAPNDPLNRDPIREMPIGGDRKKHLMPEDHMLNSGVADAIQGGMGHGRKHIDTFAGRTQMVGVQDKYRSNWKQDPSKLMGTSLLC